MDVKSALLDDNGLKCLKGIIDWWISIHIQDNVLEDIWSTHEDIMDLTFQMHHLMNQETSTYKKYLEEKRPTHEDTD
jgi:hypothetical protein